MVSKVFSCSFTGLDCHIIEVQADVSKGLSMFSIVGMGDASVQESKERVRSSIKNSGVIFPTNRKTINLAPAQLRKQGTLFDLPIAISILLASQQLTQEKFQNAIIVGELSLTGKIKKVNGALAITQHAKEQGFKKIFLPQENAAEASFISGIEIYAVNDLRELIEFSLGKITLKPQSLTQIQHKNNHHSSYPLSSVIGHEKAKRALSIGAAGGHNMLLEGSPGCGKTLLCRTFRSLLTEMNSREILESTKIYSIAGLLNSNTPLISERPFREIHHTASKTSIIGGGNQPRPGEITLAHNGVLFFDEIAEFKKTTLECLRQPLEDKFININRSKNSFRFPSNFIFLATMNPCPCGYRGDKKIPCICSDFQVKTYRKKLSGPLLDRFDLFLEISKIPMQKIFTADTNKEETEHLKTIQTALIKQRKRFEGSHISKNADMQIHQIKKFCQLESQTQNLLDRASKVHNLSNRGYLKILKIARTIADLEAQDNINYNHIAEALQYRQMKN